MIAPEPNGQMPDVTLYVVVTEKPPTLEEAQEFVGRPGHRDLVEIVRLPNGDQMLVNEEGLLFNLPVNPAATLVAQRLIVGNALVLTGKAKWD